MRLLHLLTAVQIGQHISVLKLYMCLTGVHGTVQQQQLLPLQNSSCTTICSLCLLLMISHFRDMPWPLCSALEHSLGIYEGKVCGHRQAKDKNVRRNH
jgi:hypothetical protein